MEKQTRDFWKANVRGRRKLKKEKKRDEVRTSLPATKLQKEKRAEKSPHSCSKDTRKD